MNETVKQALLSVSQNIYLYTTDENTEPPFIVYGVDGENNLIAENERSEFADIGYIHLFTTSSEDNLIFDIPGALEAFGVSFYLSLVKFEKETSLFNYEWRWECA